MYLIEITAYSHDDEYFFEKKVEAPSLKEARKAATSLAWQACQRGVYPKKVFNAVKHNIAVSENRGMWCRFRSDNYWMKLGIDEMVLNANSVGSP